MSDQLTQNQCMGALLVAIGNNMAHNGLSFYAALCSYPDEQLRKTMREVLTANTFLTPDQIEGIITKHIEMVPSEVLKTLAD